MLKLREPRVRAWRASVVSVDTRLKKGGRCGTTHKLKLREQP